METLPRIPENLTYIGNLQEWLKLDISNDIDARLATDRLGDINTRKKQIDTFRDEFIRPQKRILADFEGKCRDALRPFLEIEAVIRKNLGAYMDSVRIQKQNEMMAQKQKQLEEQRQKAQELQKLELISGDVSPLLPIVEANIKAVEKIKPQDLRQSIKTSDVMVTQSLVWEWEVIDKLQIPHEYLAVDEKKINALNRAGIRNIPGISYKQVSRVGVR